MSRKLLDERVERSDVRTLDFHQRRITNAHPSINDYDYVVRKELEPLKASRSTIISAAQESIRVPGLVTFTANQTDPGFLDINNVEIAGSSSAHVDFITFSMDMSDIAFYGEMALDTSDGPADYIEDFANVAVSVIGTSYQGRTFKQGDFLFCLVPASPGQVRLVQIKAIVSPVLWTIQFRGIGDAADKSFFGTPRIASSRFYFCCVDLFKRPFSALSTGIAFARDYKLLLPSKSVAVVLARAYNQGGQGGITIYNLNEVFQTSAMPGLFVDNGGFYTMPLDGDLVVGQTLLQWISTRQFAGVKCVYTKVKKPPTGANLIVDLLFISHPISAINNTRIVALHSVTTVLVNAFMSYAFNNLPQNRRSPYYGNFPFHELDVVGNYEDIFDANGDVITANLPLVPTGDKIFFTMDGDLTPMVAQIGSGNPGSDATMEFLT